MFEGKRATLDAKQCWVELAIYSGVGYRELVSSPDWFLTTIAVRMNEEAAYREYMKKHSKVST